MGRESGKGWWVEIVGRVSGKSEWEGMVGRDSSKKWCGSDGVKE